MTKVIFYCIVKDDNKPQKMIKKQKLDKIHIGGDQEIRFDVKPKAAILLLHGFTSSPLVFRKMAKYFFEAEFSVYAPVIAGHGSTPDDFSKTNITDWKKSAEEAYEKLKKDYQKVFIVGNSFGGNLAIWLAANNDVDGLVSLGTPVWLRYHNFIKFRLWLYGWMKKYYHKPKWNLGLEELQQEDDRSYPIIPIKALSSFIAFVEKETVVNLKKIKSPIMVIQANGDRVVHPRSAKHIYDNLNHEQKSIHLIDAKVHDVISSATDSQEVFEKINQFFNSILKTDTNKI